MKNHIRLFVLFSCVALIATVLSPGLRADAWDKKTILTIDKPIQLPTKVLEPGKYVFKLADSQSDRHIVQVFSEDEKHLITTILAIPNERLKPTGKSAFGFWETPAGQPQALRAWFYPGDNFGQEFAYKPSMAAEITAYNKTTVPTVSSEDVKTAEVETPKAETEQPVATAKEEPKEQTTEIARNVEPAPAPAPEAAPVAQSPDAQPAPVAAQSDRVQADRPAELPQTGSYYPLIALTGLLSLGGFAFTTARSRQRS